MNDKQQVLNLLNQANDIPIPTISRRTFCSFTGISFLSIFLPSCNFSETSLQELSQEIEFKYFFEVIFPASALGLNNYRDSSLSRIQRLPNKHALYVIQLYKHFKTRLWLKLDQGTKEYNKTLGIAILAELLRSKHSEQYNHALDIIYYEISKDNKLITAIWGRRFSLTDKKCVYWDDYDQAIS